MALYTTLFTATDTELADLFGGWRSPLPAPRKEVRQIPFGPQREITVTTWDPEHKMHLDTIPSLFETNGRALLPPVVPFDGMLAAFQHRLEDACPSLLRTLPHAAIKGITHYELQLLGAVLIGDAVPPARFVDCREDEGCIGSIQAGAVPILANASDGQLRDYALVWNQRLEQNNVDNLQWVLLRLRALAHDGVSRQANVFSHTLA